ncbi:MAG: hypothetical protein Q8O43_05015 [Dehalococcoidia bacterium]|nr:hypothetical protein [Dehalococcoidia bacterium]
MKVLLYGYDCATERVKAALLAGGHEVIDISGGLDSVVGLEESVSLAVVDVDAPQASKVCRYLQENLDIPVVVILGYGEKGWSKLDKLIVDGYIPRSARQKELMARLKAIERRVGKTATDVRWTH